MAVRVTVSAPKSRYTRAPALKVDSIRGYAGGISKRGRQPAAIPASRAADILKSVTTFRNLLKF